MVDPTSNFILSGSSDANVHVWSLPRLLSFSKPAHTGQDQEAPNSPFLTFSNHRGAITALAVGHSFTSNNIAVSAARDDTVIVWQYQQGLILRTHLLSSTAISLVLDPADRAFYVGYETGDIQVVDFYETPSIQAALFNKDLHSIPLQISGEQKWHVPAETYGPALSLTVSYDGTRVLSGHRNGGILSWDVGRRKYMATIAHYVHPITNLQMLSPEGFVSLSSPSSSPSFTIHNVVKPRYDHTLSETAHNSGSVPFSYVFNVQLTPPTQLSSKIAESDEEDIFTAALHHPFFPSSLIEEGLMELHSLKTSTSSPNGTLVHPTIFDHVEQREGKDEENQKDKRRTETLENEIAHLKQQLQTSEAARRATTDELVTSKTELRSLRDYTNELQSKREKERLEYLGGKKVADEEQRDLERREAWFEAEKKRLGSGDKLLRSMREDEQRKGDSPDIDMT